MHDIQTDLFYDYRTNVASYPAWQQWLREHQPPLLVAWGRYDPSFLVAEAEAYRRDVPDAEVHLLDAGHFALDERPDQIAELTRRFLRLLEADAYSKRTFPGRVIRRSSGSVTAITPKAMSSPAPIRA